MSHPVFYYKRYIFVLLIIGLLCISCNQNSNQPQQRIISLSPSHTEILYALGLEKEIVGWTRYCNYPPEVQNVPGWVAYDDYEFKSVADELSKKVAVVSSFTSVNYALIDSLKPTLILSIHQMQHEISEQLQAKGYRILHFEPVTLEDVFQMIETIGDATGKGKCARELTAGYRKEIEAIQAITKNLPQLAVYFEINHSGPYVLGAGSPMDQIVDIAGGRNIFEDISSEAFKADLNDIINRNPDIILTPLWPHAGREEVTTIREIVSRPGFENVKAVQNSRVYFYDSSMLKHPGPRQVTAIKKLAYLLHPYYFSNPPDAVDPWELGKIDATYPPPAPLR